MTTAIVDSSKTEQARCTLRIANWVPLLALLATLTGCGGIPSARTTLPTQHNGSVYDVLFSPDGKSLASAGLDGKLFLWDVSNVGNLRALGVHDTIGQNVGFLRGIVFSMDGTRVAAVRTMESIDSVVVFTVGSLDQTATITLPPNSTGL